MSKKIVVFVIIVIFILFSFMFYNIFEKEEEIDITELFGDMREESFNETGDANFIIYTKKYIDSICPFYQPSGMGYRACLFDLYKERENKTQMNIEDKEKIEKYCSDFSDKFKGGTAEEGSYLTCLIYKLANFNK